MTAAPTTVAAFDVDGTLTTRDCVVPFLRRFLRRRSAAVGTLRNAQRGVVAVGRRDRDRLRAAATAAVLTGVPRAEIEAVAGEFASIVIAGRLRADTTARLRWHLEQGHRVVLVSASYDVYLEHLAASLGAEAVLATRLAYDADDRCTGGLDGPNCRAGEKVRRLELWLTEQGVERSAVDLWAYGDSPGDRDLLESADHPVWVTEPLASVAPSA